MPQIHAQLKRLRIAPRKVRLVAEAIKGRDVGEAELELKFLVKRGSEPLLKLLKSAVANAHHNAKVPATQKLFVRDIRVDEGPSYKRFMPRARGRATPIKKRTSHILLVLDTRK